MINKLFKKLYDNDDKNPLEFLFASLLFGGFGGFMFSIVIGVIQELEFGFNPIGFLISIMMIIIVGFTINEKTSSIILLLITISIFSIISIIKFNIFHWILIPLILIALEILFFIDKEKPKKNQNKFWFTVKKKFEALLEVIIIFFSSVLVYRLIRKTIPSIIEWFKQNYQIIIKWIGYIGIGAISIAALIGLLYLYIKLNSLKYRK